jgi:hypothetical protein
LLVIAYGMILGHSNGANYLVSVAGLIILLGSLYGWGLEPSAEPEDEDEGHRVLVGVGAATTAGALGSGPAAGGPAAALESGAAGGTTTEPATGATGGPATGAGAAGNGGAAPAEGEA